MTTPLNTMHTASNPNRVSNIVRGAVVVLAALLGLMAISIQPASAADNADNTISADDFETICKEVGGIYDGGDSDGFAVCSLPDGTICAYHGGEGSTSTMICFFERLTNDRVSFPHDQRSSGAASDPTSGPTISNPGGHRASIPRAGVTR